VHQEVEEDHHPEVAHSAAEAAVIEAVASAEEEAHQEAAEVPQEVVAEEALEPAEAVPEVVSVLELRFSCSPMRDSREFTFSEVKTMPSSPRT
jgi:hypothetical protein